MITVDVFDGCLSDLFSAFRITDSPVNRAKGKSILLSHFGGRDGMAERAQELDSMAASLAAREQEMDAHIKNGTAELNKARASLQQEYDVRTARQEQEQTQRLAARERELDAHIKDGIKAGLDAQAASLTQQSQELEQQALALSQRQTELDRMAANVTAEVNKSKAILQKEYDDRVAIHDQELDRRAAEIAKSQLDTQAAIINKTVQELAERNAALDKQQEKLDELAAELAHKRKKDEDRPGYIYEFRNPDTHLPVYIGQTVRDPEDRAYDHMKAPLDNTNALHSWFPALYYNKGKLPELAHMKLESDKMMDRAERERIKELLKQGVKLFNVQLKIPRLITKSEVLYIGPPAEDM